MSSAAEKKAAKRRAKRDAEAAKATMASLEAVTAGMSTAGTTAAQAAALSTVEASSAGAAAAAAASSAAMPVSSDPRVQLKERGNRAFTSRDMQEAIRCFTEAIALPADTGSASTEPSTGPPLLASLYSNRSAAHAALYDWPSALADATQCVALAPSWGKGYFRQGAAHEGLMKFPAAVAAYEAGLKAEPNDLVLQRQLEHVCSMISEMSAVKPEQAKENPEEDRFETMTHWLIAGKSRFPALYLKYYSEVGFSAHSLRLQRSRGPSCMV